MRILKLEISNVKRLVAVQIKPDGSLVVIGGKNGAGKSSVLDAIMYALAGKETIPAEPVRKGQRRAKTVIDLEGGLRVTRTYDAAGGSQLTITDGKGDKQRSPQALLDELCGEIAFDPLEYARMKSDRQAAILRELVGLDTSGLDRDRQRVFDQRTERNREIKALRARFEAMPLHENTPAEPIDVGALVDSFSALQETVSANAAERRKAEELQQRVEKIAAIVSETDAEIAALTERLDLLREKRAAIVVDVETATAAAGAQATKAAALVDPDFAAHKQRLQDAQETNKRVAANKERAELEAQTEAAERAAEALTDEIARIDEAKQQQLSAAKFPIPGLGFDEDGVTLAGVPLEQASQAERLRVSVAMGLAMNPKLRVVLIRDGSLLDEESLAIVARMAEEANAQIWLEKVSEGGDGCSVVIEDGMVRGAVAEPAPAIAAAEAP